MHAASEGTGFVTPKQRPSSSLVQKVRATTSNLSSKQSTPKLGSGKELSSKSSKEQSSKSQKKQQSSKPAKQPSSQPTKQSSSQPAKQPSPQPPLPPEEPPAPAQVLPVLPASYPAKSCKDCSCMLALSDPVALSETLQSSV